MLRDPRGSLESRVCLALRAFPDLGDPLVQLEKKVPRDLQGPTEPQDPSDLLVLVSLGLRAKRDHEERKVNQESVPVLPGESLSFLACRVLRDCGWAAPRSRARRVPQVSLDHQVLPECLDCRECLDTTVCQDSLGSLPSWDPYPLSGTFSRASVVTVPRARRPIQPSFWRKEKRGTRASLACQVSTTVPGASSRGSGQELRRPGETTVRGNLAVLGAPACLVLQGCQAKEEKRVHLA